MKKGRCRRPGVRRMRYGRVIKGIFLDRPNRFVARVQLGGRTETVHVKNTGRCRELLARAAQEGCHAAVAFVIQMDGVTLVRPNTATHPEFGTALRAAQSAGVEVVYLPCHVEPDALTVAIGG